MGNLSNFDEIVFRGDFNLACETIYKDNEAKGFYEDAPDFDKRLSDGSWLHQRAALIAGELAEGYEALRAGNISPLFVGTYKYQFIDLQEAFSIDVSNEEAKATYKKAYEDFVKGTLEEELADTVIRMCDFLGSIGFSEDGNVRDLLAEKRLKCTAGVHKLFNKGMRKALKISSALPWGIYQATFSALRYPCAIADKYGIDLQKAIAQKLLYNSTRPYKHGKKF